MENIVLVLTMSLVDINGKNKEMFMYNLIN